VKPNTLYKFDIPADIKNEGMILYWENLLGIKMGETVLCFGEITNMPDHYILVGRNGKVVYGVDSMYLTEAVDDDLFVEFTLEIDELPE